MNEKPVSLWQRQFLPRVSLFRLIRWLFSWRMIRRYLFCAACLATLIALFYAEENWRGKHAWEKFKTEWEAKDEKFDPLAFAPPPVPDEQNFAMAPFWGNVRAAWDAHKKGLPIDFSDVDLAHPNEHMGPRYYRTDPLAPTMAGNAGSWRSAAITDLKGWQGYYRASVNPQSSRAALLAQLNVRTLGGNKANSTTNEFPFPPRPGSPAEDVLLALSHYGDALDQLRLASHRPYARFPIDYEDFPNAFLPHLFKMKTIAGYLQLRAVAELAAKQDLLADEDVNLLFCLADSTRSEPFLLSQLVRDPVLDTTLSTVWEGMSGHRWSESQLKGFQDKIESENLLFDFLRATKFERVEILTRLDQLASSRMNFFSPSPSNWRLRDHWQEFVQPTRWKALGRILYLQFAPRGWFDQAKVSVSRLFVEDLPVVDPQTQRVDYRRPASRKAGSNSSSVILLVLSQSVTTDADTWSRTVDKAVRAQTALNLGAVACALERYWAANNSYPEKLDELVPKFIAKLPHEIVSGEPLKYLRTPDGRFVLYSTGINGNDSGGLYRTADHKETGNWVWRYPDSQGK